MKYAVVMTFPSWKWKEYGYCMKGFVENWPKEVQGYALVEKPQDIPIDIPSNLTVIDFDEVLGSQIKQFEDRNKDKPIFDLGTTGNIGLQAAKFARKAYAQLHVLENIDADVIFYIDADLYNHKPVSMEILDKMVTGDHYIGCTPRWWKPDGYTETGLMMWRKSMTEQHKEWCSLYRSCYDEDKIFEIGSPGKQLPFPLPDGWHDCISFDYATKTMLQDKKIIVSDFGFGVRSSHPLVSGPLGKWFDHMKGQRKFVGESKERVKVHGK